MKHPIYKVMLSVALGIIITCCLYFLWKIIPSPNEGLQYINYHKAILYGSAIVGCVVGLLLIHCKIK